MWEDKNREEEAHLFSWIGGRKAQWIALSLPAGPGSILGAPEIFSDPDLMRKSLPNLWSVSINQTNPSSTKQAPAKPVEAYAELVLQKIF